MPALKVFRAHLGFYDAIVAVTSQRKALAAWGAGPGEFTKGFAAATKDPQAVRAALASPGVVLRRPFGTSGDFKREVEIPPAPKLSPTQKRRAAEAERRRRKQAAAQARAETARSRGLAGRAKAELAEIARAEDALRRRKTALQKKLRAPEAQAITGHQPSLAKRE